MKKFDNTPRIRKPKPVTEERLFNAAIYYLQRFSATAAHTKTILQRKVKKWTEQEPDWAIGADDKIDKAIERIVALGYINDAIFAESRVRSLRRQGKSSQIIKQHLRQKGVMDHQLVSDSMDKADTEFVQAQKGLGEELEDDIRKEAELHALQRLVKRKRLLQSTDPDQRQKDIAKIMRAGFGWDNIKTILGGRVEWTSED